MDKKLFSDVYIASCVPDGGILRYRLGQDGSFVFVDKLDLPSPNYLVRQGNVMYATLRRVREDSEEGGVVRLRVGEDGALSVDGEIAPSGGTATCHLAFDGDDLYVANYLSGSVTKIGHPPVCHEGHGVNPTRQSSPHCHCTFFSPDRRFLLVCDLGLDTVFVYDRDLNEVSRAKVPDGEGCRHLVFSNDGKLIYVENEMGCSVSVFSYENGHMTYLHTVPTRTYLPHEGPDKGSAIRLSRDGRRLYVTNRGENEAVVLRVRGAQLRVINRAQTKGDEPRDLSLLLDERFALVTNQFGNSVILYKLTRVPRGHLKAVTMLDIPAPICVTE